MNSDFGPEGGGGGDGICDLNNGSLYNVIGLDVYIYKGRGLFKASEREKNPIQIMFLHRVPQSPAAPPNSRG